MIYDTLLYIARLLTRLLPPRPSPPRPSVSSRTIQPTLARIRVASSFLPISTVTPLTSRSDLFSPGLPGTPSTLLTSFFDWSTQTASESSFSAPARSQPSEVMTTPPSSRAATSELHLDYPVTSGTDPLALGGWGREWEKAFLDRISLVSEEKAFFFRDFHFPQPPARSLWDSRSKSTVWPGDSVSNRPSMSALTKPKQWEAEEADVHEEEDESDRKTIMGTPQSAGSGWSGWWSEVSLVHFLIDQLTQGIKAVIRRESW